MILRVLIKRHEKLINKIATYIGKPDTNEEDNLLAKEISNQIYKIELIFTNLIWYWCVYKLRKFPYDLDVITKMKKNIKCTVNEDGELLYQSNIPLEDEEPIYRNITPILARVSLKQ